MEDSVGPSSVKPLSFSEQLENLCEYYMSIGVPYDEFWFGDYCKLKFYEKRYFNQQRQRNYEMWQMGMYVCRAFETVLAHAFNKNSKAEYPKAPFGEERDEKAMTQEELLASIDKQLRATIKE